ncbi:MULTISPECIES: hypothetical protein [unclassified Polaribacter]|uniref:hypothetical protein n=1 Tax=unclassified Polaribacter TaxID=196858 RepID=UPI0011BDFAA9|nr:MULTISPECIES: hypothetical protein [unclassified Polaribacter]TXD52617.1 hypothetical protein ES043_08025 [Polaribacter sp. IC063]TXD61821.1 hypothetical protein ES044_03625 [Polaribacter sp. IC066]
MSDFKEFFEAIQQSITNDEFVKLTVSKPLRKSDGLANVYVRFLKIDEKEVFEFKYRYVSENLYKKFSLNEALAELEQLLLETFRAGTLFTLSYDLLVMISKKKQVSCRDTAPSFKNKLPEFSQESRESEDSQE